jgi:hypothetical protein
LPGVFIPIFGNAVGDKKHERTTKGFVPLGHDVEPIIGSENPRLVAGGRNSAGL